MTIGSDVIKHFPETHSVQGKLLGGPFPIQVNTTPYSGPPVPGHARLFSHCHYKLYNKGHAIVLLVNTG